MDVSFSYFDMEFGYSIDDPMPERPFWFLRSEQSPAEVELRPAWENEIQVDTPAMDAKALRRWVESARESSAIDWRELLVRAVRLRLPWSPDELHQEVLQIRLAAHVIDYPIERGQSLFACGPLKRKSVPAPLDLSIVHQTGVATMDIDVNWSLWTDPRERGYGDLRNAVERLRAGNWKCVYSEIEGL